MSFPGPGGLPRSLAGMLALMALVGCREPVDDDDDTTAGPEPEAFAIAILTDTHVGEGFLDYGDPGFDDAAGNAQDHGPTERLAEAVAKVNAAVDEHGVRVVMALGDFTDSAERSELARAREILDGLDVPYVPLIGNHDMWPYAWTDGESFVEAEGPTGDALFDEVFADHFAGLQDRLPGFEKAPTPSTDPATGDERFFVNLAFDLEDIHLVGLDLGTRDHAPLGYPGVGPEADLHDLDGGTWPWFTGHLEAYPTLGERNVLLFSHHPPLPLGLDSLSSEEFDTVEAFIHGLGDGDHVGAFFAGHWHLDLVSDLYGDEPVVVTAATKDEATVRIIRVSPDGAMDYGTLL